MSWEMFETRTPQERLEREAVLGEIKAAETAALAELRKIRAIAERHGTYAASAGSAALTHLATMAGVEGQTLFRHGNEYRGKTT